MISCSKIQLIFFRRTLPITAYITSFFVQCETVHHEMTHFLRNVYSYLSTEVIETCWVEFLHRVAALCGLTPSFVDRGQRHNDTYLELDRLSDDNGWSADGSSSMVDRLIRIHEDYVQSMLVSPVLFRN